MKLSGLNLWEWLLIFLLHLVLLVWIFYVLNNAGNFEFSLVTAHFIGLSLYGAGLIRFCAWYIARKYRRSFGRHQ